MSNESFDDGVSVIDQHFALEPSRPRVMQLMRTWMLLVPMLFLAVHGQFSFTQTGRNIEGSGSLATADLSGGSSDDALLRIFVYLSYGIVLSMCVVKFKRVRRVLWTAKPVILLALLALCSVIWSQQAFLSLRSAIYYSLDTLLGLYLVATFTLEELMSLMVMTGYAVIACTVVMVAFFPEYGVVQGSLHHGVWQGIFADENDAGKNCVFLLTPVLGRKLFKLRNLLYASLLLGVIYKTGSKTALVALMSVSLFALVREGMKRLHPKSAVFVSVVIALCLTAALAVLVMDWAQISVLLGRDPTLTGRTDIWSMLIESAEARPLLGYGYAAFWTGMDGESGKVYQAVHWIFTYAHNGFLEVWLQLGLVGVGVVVWALLQAARNAVRCAGRASTRGTEWLTMVLLLTVIYNLDEGTLMFSRTLVSVLFVITCAGLERAAGQRHTTEFLRLQRKPEILDRGVQHA